MSTVVAIVKSMVGQVIATSAEGAQRVLVEGDRLYVGDTLDTGAGGMVTLELADGRMLDLGRETQWSSADAASSTPTQSVAAAQTEVLDVQRAIAAGADPTQDLAPTAAGPGAGGAGGAAGGSHSYVLLAETAGEVQPEIGITFTDPTGGDAVVQEQTFGDNLNLPPSFTSADGNNANSTINVTTDEDIAYSGNFTAVDGNGDALTFSVVGTGVSHGSLTLTPQGAWTYTPAANYNGPDSFQVVVSDGRGGSDTLTVNIGVTPVNDAPVADAATGSATEDGAIVSGQLSASDVDSGDTQTFTLQAGTTAPAGFTLNANGTWSIDPSNAAYQSLGAGQQLTIDVPFTVTDSGGLTSNSVLTLTITGVNDAAVLSSATETVVETDSAITTGGTLTISDIDSPATFVAQTNSAGNYGTFSIDAAGVWSFTANSAYNELNVGQSLSDSFDVFAADGTKTTVTVTINGSNDAPVASSTVVANGSEDPAAPIAVTLGGSDVDGTVVSYTVQSLPTNGTLFADAAVSVPVTVGVAVSGPVYFVPNADWNGTTTFDYTATDNSGATSAPATATINVSAVPDAPTVAISTDADNDGTVTNVELGGSPTLTVTVGLPADAAAGNTVTVTGSTGTPVLVVLTPAIISAGVITATFPVPADGSTFTATATVTDNNGLTSPSASDSAVIGDTTATAAPTVVISTDVNNDGTLSNTELGASTSVTVKITVPTGTLVGDTLNITNPNGSVTPHTVVAADLTDGVTLTYPRPADGQPISVSATITDAAGNTSAPGSDSATVGDTTATAAPTVVISTDTNNDGTLSNVELGTSTSVTVKITVPAGTQVGDTLNITNPNGSVTPHTVVAADLTDGLTLTYPRPADGVGISVSATVTDAAGNTSVPGSDSAIVGNTTAPAAPTVVITTDSNNDGILSNTELGNTTSIGTFIKPPAGAKPGDILTLFVNGSQIGTIPVSQALITNGLTLYTYRGADGSALTVSATLTDADGNVSAPGSDNAVIGDTTATAAPTVVISTDSNNNGVLSAAELGNSTTVTVKITVPNGTLVGDTLNITNPDGSVTAHTIVAADLTNGVELTYPRPADGVGLSVSATITDAAGNKSLPGSDSATVGDTTATAAPTVAISTDSNNDGTLSSSELGTATTVTVKITVPTGTVIGDTLNITNPDGSVTPHTVVAADLTDGVTLTYPRPADGAAINVSATITDAAGNTSAPGSDSATVGDTTATAAPTVVISTDANNDGTLSAIELSATTIVTVKITVPTGTVAGDTLKITNPDGSVSTHTVVAADLTDGLELTYPRPADGTAINVSATITDAAGNTSAPGSDSATVGDTTATAAP
ncbi:MAG: retention module-containing protein, partial [Pseudomonas sp.]|uniref:retention module-containing protein n=1 Tax=Pseudomonas sp. TaxID=306 RepID=UPI0030F130FB